MCVSDRSLLVDLLAPCQRQRNEGWTRWQARDGRIIWQVAYKYRMVEEAEDAVQDIFAKLVVKLWKQTMHWKGGCLEHMVRKTAQRHFLMQLRKAGSGAAKPTAFSWLEREGWSDDPIALQRAAVRHELMEGGVAERCEIALRDALLHKAIVETLSPREVWILGLDTWGEQTHRQISARLQMPIGSVGTTLGRARAKLGRDKQLQEFFQ